MATKHTPMHVLHCDSSKPVAVAEATQRKPAGEAARYSNCRKVRYFVKKCPTLLKAHI